MSVSGRSVFTRAFDDYLFEVTFLDLPNPDNLPALLAQIDALGESTAAFIFEPLVQGAGGMAMYDAPSLDALLAHCRSKSILLIADEIMTGFGRTGANFAMDQLATAPDMITLSKGLTGGTMAMGITTCTAEIYEAFLSTDKLKTLFHGHSFTANPLTCAVALASLELFLEPSCAENRRRIAAQHRQFAEELRARKEVRNVRQAGTILAFEISTGEADGYTNDLADFLHAFFRERRVMLRPLGNTLYILPPYCITNEQLAVIYTSILDMLTACGHRQA
ncbi:aminotransferase class III-fold pyridoxal phosphate-dependent enzyme [Chitinophaga pollutisoli]|uniref:Aminotransferase class III-fold pyridoxal phosphate-dependent enzyme n=1 Tax=Chitinophaga pollutisoli TaxID=3133966 RepID=A0ABZ2YQW4_9BACT